jgi:hypothetical protein
LEPHARGDVREQRNEAFSFGFRAGGVAIRGGWLERTNFLTSEIWVGTFFNQGLDPVSPSRDDGVIQRAERLKVQSIHVFSGLQYSLHGWRVLKPDGASEFCS